MSEEVVPVPIPQRYESAADRDTGIREGQSLEALAKLRENGWNVAATAKAIETPRSNLYKKLDAHGINREQDP